MGCISTDLTIETALADPMIGALMRADRVDPRRFEAWLRSKALSLGKGRDAAARTSELRSRQALCGAAS